MEASDYVTAYLHFRRDHKINEDLVYHFCCLFYQLGGNYGLLGELDRAMGWRIGNRMGVLSGLTSLGWGTTLLTSPTPWSVKAASLISIGVVHYVQPVIQRNWRILVTLQAFCEALGLHVMLWRGSNPLVTMG